MIVGYGDQYLFIVLGKVVGCLLIVFGVLVIVFFVFFFVMNFKKVMNVSMMIVSVEKERKKLQKMIFIFGNFISFVDYYFVNTILGSRDLVVCIFDF